MLTPFERSVVRAIAGEWDRAGCDPPMMYPYDRVLVARRAVDRVGFDFGEDPRLLAALLGIRIVPARANFCGGELAGRDAIFLSYSSDRHLRGLRIFHGVAHALLLREGWEHSHADVWLLTGELVACAHVCTALELEELRRRAHAPAWFVEAWVPMARQLGRHRQVA